MMIARAAPSSKSCLHVLSCISGNSYRHTAFLYNTLTRRNLCTTNLTHSPIFQPFHFNVNSCSTVSDVDQFHTQMIKHGNYSDGFIGDRLVTIYAKFGNVDNALKLFEEIPDKDVVSWNSMIVVFAQRGDVKISFSLFSKMRSGGLEPNEVTLISILPVCINMRALVQGGTSIHCYVVKCGFLPEIKVVNSLVNMYGKCHSVNAAYRLFNDISCKNLVSWNSMIAAYSQNGFLEDGINLFNSMRKLGFGPDRPTVVTLLQVCAELTAEKQGYAIHGYAREAIKVFDRMVKNGAKPDHVTFTHILSVCSHSGLMEEGRLGRLDEAHELIKAMPMDPNPGVWGALIGACRVHHNIKLGKEIAEKLFMLDPTDARNYIMLSNMYSASGLWREASKVRVLMKERGLKKDPGCSFIQHGGKVYRFVVGDRSHPESDDIYSKLDQLLRKIQKAGYVPNTDLVLHDVDEEMKEDMISKHSEKIAIAFGLLVTSHGRPITVTNNLRICGDCHNAAKLISLVEKCKIIIRDSKRFHHFVNGVCSCGDYW